MKKILLGLLAFAAFAAIMAAVFGAPWIANAIWDIPLWKGVMGLLVVLAVIGWLGG